MFAATGSRELTAMVLAIKAANRDLKREIMKTMRETMNPVWKEAVAANTTGTLAQKMITPSTMIKAGNPPVMQAAASKRKTTRGKRMVPDRDWAGFEYGGDRNKTSTYQRKNPGGSGTHQVTRRTQRHLRPRRKAGYVIGPAVAEVAPRLMSLAVQSVVRTYMSILDR